VKKKHFIFIIQIKNKNKNKKVKSFYKKLKPGDFTMAEGHGHPLV
jgi:preprotein translocase subunit YajC